MPAPTEIPAPIVAYSKIVAVNKLVVEFQDGSGGLLQGKLLAGRFS